MQLKVNLADGTTDTFKLPEELSNWQRRASDPEYQVKIRGVGVVRGEEYCVVPCPRMFRMVEWSVEASEQHAMVRCFTDSGIMIEMVAYNGKWPLVTRFGLIKLGKARFRPSNEKVDRGA